MQVVAPGLKVFSAGGEKQALLQFRSDAFLPCFSFKRPNVCLFHFSDFILETLAFLNSNILKSMYTLTSTHPPVNCLQFLDPFSLPFTM